MNKLLTILLLIPLISFGQNEGILLSAEGDTKYNLKDYSGAIADYTKVIELKPEDDYAYSSRGDAKYKLEDYYGAIADYTKVIELNPEDAYAYAMRGDAKDQLEDHFGAIADHTKAIELDPEDDIHYSSRGDAYDPYGQAQNTSLDGFFKSNWGQSLAEVKANNSAKGYEYFEGLDNILAVRGVDFAGTSDCMIIWMFTSDKLFQGIVSITPDLTANAMSEYDNMKAKISGKYGAGVTISIFDPPYKIGSEHWETAFKLGKGSLSTFWTFEDENKLEMRLMENLTIKITYQSTELFEENIKQQDAAINDDL
jgi:tetratricopeptide (TPR) repeat protein